MSGDDGVTAAAVRFAAYQRVLEVRDPDVTPARLLELASDASRPVRVAVARHPRSPSAALALLLLDADSEVSGSALHHRSTPPAALAAYGAHGHADFEVLAHHPNAPRAFRGRCSCPGICRGALAFSRWVRLRTIVRMYLRR